MLISIKRNMPIGYLNYYRYAQNALSLENLILMKVPALHIPLLLEI